MDERVQELCRRKTTGDLVCSQVGVIDRVGWMSRLPAAGLGWASTGVAIVVELATVEGTLLLTGIGSPCLLRSNVKSMKLLVWGQCLWQLVVAEVDRSTCFSIVSLECMVMAPGPVVEAVGCARWMRSEGIVSQSV